MAVFDLPYVRSSPLESLRFYRQQMLDVRAAREDALQVDPTPLDVDPNVKQSHDAVQLVLPAQSVLLKHLEKKKKKNAAEPMPDV